MFIQVEAPRGFATVTIVCTFLTFVEATRSFKMFQKKKKTNHFSMGKVLSMHPVGNNFSLNVLSNHRSVNGQQMCHAVRLRQRHLSFLCLLLF